LFLCFYRLVRLYRANPIKREYQAKESIKGQVYDLLVIVSYVG